MSWISVSLEPCIGVWASDEANLSSGVFRPSLARCTLRGHWWLKLWLSGLWHLGLF